MKVCICCVTIVIIGLVGSFCMLNSESVKGPINRFNNELREKLDDEFLVDNYKAEYVDLNKKKTELCEALQKTKINLATTDKKLEYALQKVQIAKQTLINTGTSNVETFNLIKQQYENLNNEVKNLNQLKEVYSNALDKLSFAMQVVKSNMQKAKSNVDTLETKKLLVDTTKSINKTLENVSLRGDSNISMPMEKLEDEYIAEQIKLEVLSKDSVNDKIENEEQAKLYLENVLKQ